MVPLLNSAAAYTFLPPFNTNNGNVIYTCKAISFIRECLANKQNPYETIYLKNNLSKETYENALHNDELIISFQTTQDRWLYIPSSYIQSSNLNGVPYHRVMIGINLGSLPVDFVIEGMYDTISGIVLDNLGIQPTIKKVILSPQALISTTDHETVGILRESRKADHPSSILKCAEYESQITEYRERIEELEEYILRNADVLGL
jgi:hypothetical protein